MSDYDDLIASLQGKNSSYSNFFIPKWNLIDGSRISRQEVAIEFSHHAFLMETIIEMESFLDVQTVDFLEFAFS